MKKDSNLFKIILKILTLFKTSNWKSNRFLTRK